MARSVILSRKKCDYIYLRKIEIDVL